MSNSKNYAQGSGPTSKNKEAPTAKGTKNGNDKGLLSTIEKKPKAAADVLRAMTHRD